MIRLRNFIASFRNWATVRYAISGGFVGAFTLATPIVLNSAFGLPLEACIPVVYLVAVTMQFTLQRVFVFRHVTTFALPIKHQILWYVVIVAIQYPSNAAGTAVLPSVLGLPQRVVYAGMTLAIALVTFLFLRRNVFHAREELEVMLEMASANTDHGSSEPAVATN